MTRKRLSTLNSQLLTLTHPATQQVYGRLAHFNRLAAVCEAVEDFVRGASEWLICRDWNLVTVTCRSTSAQPTQIDSYWSSWSCRAAETSMFPSEWAMKYFLAPGSLSDLSLSMAAERNGS